MRPAEDTRRLAGAWARQPILWIGAAIFGISAAGCAAMVVLGQRYHDTPVDTAHRVFSMPLHEPAAAPAGRLAERTHAP